LLEASFLVIAFNIDRVPPGGKGPRTLLDVLSADGGGSFGLEGGDGAGSSKAGGGSTDGPSTRDFFDGGGIIRSEDAKVDGGPGGSAGCDISVFGGGGGIGNVLPSDGAENNGTGGFGMTFGGGSIAEGVSIAFLIGRESMVGEGGLPSPMYPVV
jgi:hypothetical protein